MRLQNGDREGAAEALRQILELEPDNERARETLEAITAGDAEEAS
jgi:predicted TPR repeat methyltransferase